MFIISEISPQFGRDLDIAEQMILQSKISGASAVKVQLFSGEFVRLPDGTDRSYLELSFDGFKRLKEYGDKINIPVFGTAFSLDRLEWCKELNQKYYKIAARTHNEDFALVESILSLNKTTFVSIPSNYDFSSLVKHTNCIYLYCVTQYPTLLENVTMPSVFSNDDFLGISDHSPGISAALISCARGARYIEKHFTISNAWQCHTEKAHFGSMTVDDLVLLNKLTSEMERNGALCKF